MANSGTQGRDAEAAAGAATPSSCYPRALIEASLDPLVAIGPDETITDVNEATVRITGMPRERLLGTDFADCFTEPAKARKQYRRACIEGFVAGCPLAIRREDGSITDVIYNASVYKDATGKVLGVFAAARDVSAAKRAELTLREGVERFRQVVEHAPDAIVVYDCDRQCLIEVNAQAERLFSCPRQRIIELGLQHFYAPEQPDSRPVAQTFLENQKRALAGQRFVYERRIRPAAGEDRLCEVTLVRLPATTSRLVRCSLIDVTDRRRAYVRLQEEETKFRSLVEQNIAGIAIVGSDLSIRYFNPYLAGLLGYTAEETIGRKFLDVVADTCKAIVADHINSHVSETGGFVQLEIDLLNKNGGVVNVSVNAAPSVYEGQAVSLGILLDITERKKTDQALKRANRALRTLSEGNGVVVHSANEGDLMRDICRVIVESGYRMAWIGMREDGVGDALKSVAVAGMGGGGVEGARRVSCCEERAACRMCATAIRTGDTQTSKDLPEPSLSPWCDELRERGFASAAAFPLKRESGVFGVLGIYSAEADAFDRDELKLLEELARDLAYAINALRDRQDKVKIDKLWRDGLEATIAAIANTVELRDPYTAGHQQRVARLAAAIATRLKFSEFDIRGLYLAGAVHDVGKIDIPAEFLSKPGRLSELEHALIKTHAEHGYNILKGIHFPWPIADIVRQHHERIDGSGYPQGLAGDAILPEAKILAVADVVEAMMSHRPYRAALGIDAALAEIEKGKGSAFDPATVEACVALFREGGFTFD